MKKIVLSGNGRITYTEKLIKSGAKRIDIDGKTIFQLPSAKDRIEFNRKGYLSIITQSKAEKNKIQCAINSQYSFCISEFRNVAIDAIKNSEINSEERSNRSLVFEKLLALEENIQSQQSNFHIFNMEVLTAAIIDCPERVTLISELLSDNEVINCPDYALYIYQLLSILHADDMCAAQSLAENIARKTERRRLTKIAAIGKILGPSADEKAIANVKKLIFSEKFL